MAILTVIYTAYAVTLENGATNTVYAVTLENGATNTVYAAFLYEGEPIEWYYPWQLGITEIIDYGAGKNATWLHVVVPHERNPGGLRVERPIFKWEVNGKFYQISDLHVTPGEPAPLDYLTRGQVLGAIGIAGGWCFTGVLFWKGRKER